MNDEPEKFLSTCEVIDIEDVAIRELARKLAKDSPLATAGACFEFVRDEIKHSSDYRLNPVTCRASDVLKHRTGYCYAKSHLLCALLRANGIPSGLCYQRLTIADDRPPFCLHGLNAVYLADHGWYRVDSRGNRDGIDAQFAPPHERLAFSTSLEGEFDLPQVYVSPLPEVVDCLKTYETWDSVYKNLPDVEVDP